MPGVDCLMVYCNSFSDTIGHRHALPPGMLILGAVGSKMDVSVLEYVANDTNAYEIWQKLSGLYGRKNILTRNR